LKKEFDRYVTSDEFNILKQRVDNLEKHLRDLRNLVKTLEEKMAGMKPGSGGGANQEELDNLRELLDLLKKEFIEFKNNANKNLQDLNVTMPTKADKSELNDLEQRFRDKLDEILR